VSTALQAAQRYLAVRRPERALESLAELDADAATSADAHRLRASAFLMLEDFDRAAQSAADGLEVEPASVALLLLLSIAEEGLGRLAESERAILSALEQEPDDAQLLCQYADVLMRGRQLDKAGRVLDAAAAADPDEPDILAGRQALAYLRGHDREARRLSQELLALDPESARGHRMLGMYDLQRGRAGSAAQRFGEVVRGDPADDAVADAARQASAMARNPLWWPTLLFSRFGAAGSWIGAVVIIFGLRAMGLTAAAGIASLVWIVLCIWSWVVPPILERRAR
jgi:tetratricopeptide (TPR) repeat protein